MVVGYSKSEHDLRTPQAQPRPSRYHRERGRAWPSVAWQGKPGMGQATRLPNKELKLTKPSIMELRSLTPVFHGLLLTEAAARVGPVLGQRIYN